MANGFAHFDTTLEWVASSKNYCPLEPIGHARPVEHEEVTPPLQTDPGDMLELGLALGLT